MRRGWVLFIFFLTTSARADGMTDDPLLVYGSVDKFEIAESAKQKVEADGWVGRDYSKWALNLKAERENDMTRALSFSAAYRRPVNAFWDLDVGLRHDQEPGPEATRLRLALLGMMPYFIETSAAVHLGRQQVHLEIAFEHELPLNRSWMLKTGLELDMYSQADHEREVTNGLSDLEFRVSLKYERHKHLHPYFVIEHKRHFAGNREKETHAGLGLSVWF